MTNTKDEIKNISKKKLTQNLYNKKKTIKKNFFLPTSVYVTQRPPLKGF